MTRRVLPVLALLMLALILSAKEDRPRAQAAGSYVFEADMYGYNVVPSVNTQAWGFFRFFFDNTHTTADITVDVKGLSNSLVTGADIRRGRPGTNGQIVRHLSDGDFIVTAAHVTFTQAELNDMAAGNWYAVLYTSTNPEGEIRGQISPPADFLTPGSAAPARPYAQPPGQPGQTNVQQFTAPPPTPTAVRPVIAPPPPSQGFPPPAQGVVLLPQPAAPVGACLADCGGSFGGSFQVRPPNTGDGGLLGGG